MPQPQLSFSRLGCLAASILALAAPPAAHAALLDLASQAAAVEITATTSANIRLTENNYATAIADLNNDNELDLVIGAAARNDETTPIAGAAYVLYGPLETSTVDLAAADVIITGAAAGDRLGYSVAVGDLTDDGYADLVVSAERRDGPTGTRTDAGAVYVFFGPFTGSTLDISNADVTIHGANTGDWMAQALAIGDLSGDSKTDLVISTFYSEGAGDAYNSETGEAHIFFSPLAAGTIDLASSSANAVIYGADHDLFGKSLAIGDVSGDGYADLAVGAIGSYRNGGLPKGEVQVFYGPIANNSTINVQTTAPSFRLHAQYNLETLGLDVAIGDLNDDGQGDLVGVAGYSATTTQVEIGGVFIEFGPLSGSSKNMHSADVTVQMVDSANAAGIATSVTLGDLSFDGIPDLIIGNTFSSGPDDNRSVAGEIDVIYGPLTQGRVYDLDQEAPSQAFYGVNTSKLGGDILVGDLTGDDVNDLVAVAHFAPTVNGSAGKTYVFTGLRCYSDNFEDGALQSGWSLSEFGNGDTGTATESGGWLDLQGDGTGYSGTSDNMVYLNRDGLAGDFRIEATLLGVPENQGGTFRRGGLLLRATGTPPSGFTADQAPNISVAYAPVYNEGGGVQPQLRFRYRGAWGASENSFASPVIEANGNTFALPVRVAIERKNGKFAVFYLKNLGRPRWSQVLGGLATQNNGGWAAIDGLGTAPDFGFVTTSNHASTTATFRFDDYSACHP